VPNLCGLSDGSRLLPADQSVCNTLQFECGLRSQWSRIRPVRVHQHVKFLRRSRLSEAGLLQRALLCGSELSRGDRLRPNQWHVYLDWFRWERRCGCWGGSIRRWSRLRWDD